MPKDIISDPRLMGALGLIDEEGVTHAPRCCDGPMKDDGGCAEGCCDDYRCDKCGRRIRIEWPD